MTVLEKDEKGSSLKCSAFTGPEGQSVIPGSHARKLKQAIDFGPAHRRP